MDALDRFVYEVQRDPRWFAELERRDRLVENSCSTDSEYAIARRAVLEYNLVPAERETGDLAADLAEQSEQNAFVARIVKRPGCKVPDNTTIPKTPGTLAWHRFDDERTENLRLLDEILETRKGIEAVLNDPLIERPDGADQAFRRWLDACTAVYHEAIRLDVDGCTYLLHAFLAAQPGGAEEYLVYRSILKSDFGIVHLASIRDAANSLVAWKREMEVGVAANRSEQGAGQAERTDLGDAGESIPVRPNNPSATDSSIGYLGGAALADTLGVHRSQRGAFSKQLERERAKLADGVWVESANRRPNAPQYLYLADNPAIRAIAAQYREPKPA